MNWHYFDPTSDKEDMLPLTPEESKAFGLAAGVMFCLLLIAGVIIYSMVCR
jgi:hypothetical protein